MTAEQLNLCGEESASRTILLILVNGNENIVSAMKALFFQFYYYFTSFCPSLQTNVGFN